MGPLDLANLALLSLLWGGSFFFVEVLVDYLSPITIVTLRVALAAVLLWVVLLTSGAPRPKGPRDWRSLAVVGLFNNALPFMLIVWGQTRIDGGLASVLNATAPLFTILVAGAFLADERLSTRKLAGVAVGLAGVGVLVGVDSLDGARLGQLAVVGAALCYGVAGVYSRRFSARGLAPLTVATGQVTLATLMLLPIMLMTDGVPDLRALPVTALAALLGLSAFSTTLAYVIYFRLVARAGATNAALVTFLIPVWAIGLGALFLGERFSVAQGAGAALIALGLIVLDGRLIAVRKPSKQ